MAIRTARRATRISLPLLGAFVIGAIAYGGLYTFPALSVAFARDFGISRSLAVTPWTMFLIVTAISSPLLGRAYDEFADRDLLTAAMVLNAGGWLAVYLAPDISIVILAYAALHAMGLQLAFIGTTTAIARRYAGISGLALGLTYAGPGVGVAIALPVAAGIIASAGWRATALAFLAASLVGVAFVYLMTTGPEIVVPVRRRGRTRDERTAEAGRPADDGSRTRDTEAQQSLRASGLHETAAPGAVSAGFEPRPVGSRDRPHSVRRTVRTRRFWALFVGATAIGAFDEGVLQAFLPNAIRAGIGPGTAAVALGLQSVAYVFGQVLGGWLSDRLGRRPVGIVSAAVVLLGVVAAIGLAPVAPGLAIAGIIAHGVGTGATIAVRSAAFHDVFGGPNFGTIFGLLGVAYPIGGTVAVYVGAIGVDQLGSYLALIPVVVAAVAIWAGALWVAGPRRLRAGGGAAVAAENRRVAAGEPLPPQDPRN